MSRAAADSVALANDRKPHFPWPFADRKAQFVPASIEPHRMEVAPTVWARRGERALPLAAYFAIGAVVGLAIVVALFLVSKS